MPNKFNNEDHLTCKEVTQATKEIKNSQRARYRSKPYYKMNPISLLALRQARAMRWRKQHPNNTIYEYYNVMTDYNLTDIEILKDEKNNDMMEAQ